MIPELKKISENLSANANYTSPDIQNEVISVFQQIVKSMISSAVKDAEIYTIMVDRTSDKNFREIKGILLRYLNKAGQIEEHAIDVVETKDRSAGLA